MKISLIIPCYNEEANIQKGVLDKIGNFTAGDDRFSEVVIVDDGSSDSSKAVIKNKYLKQFPKFRLVENSHQGKALGNYVMFSDIDLATPIEEVGKLIGQIEAGGKIIIGSRHGGRVGAPILRKLMASGFIVVRNLIIGLHGVKDTQCGFKLFEKRAALKIIDKLRVFHDKRRVKGSSVSAGFDLEFLFLANRLHFKIVEVPVIWRHVETKNVNFLRDSVETLIDILRIKYYDLIGRYEA